MQLTERQDGTFLYQQVVDLMNEKMANGDLQPGDRLPSLRKMSLDIGVSVPTVRQAYIELERQRRVESRPQSGFFVRSAAANDLVAISRSEHCEPVVLCCQPLMVRVYEGINNPALVPLGIANPCMAKPAAKALHRAMKRVMSRAEERSLGYASTQGELALRRQIAFHYFDTTGERVEPEQICITNGGQEALLLALKSVAEPGDVVAVESPTYHGLLELIDGLGMLAIEVETCPEDGVSITALRRTLETHNVKACMLSTTLSNPLGVSLPDRDRLALVELLRETGTVLIDDDVYGDLLFDGSRPLPARFLDKQLPILTCGSFSKTAAPGYRIGWVMADENQLAEVIRLKRSFSCSSGLLQQLTLADYMATGDYGRHIKSLRPVLRQNAERMSALVARYFPASTRTSKPVGGSVLWLQLPESLRAETLFDAAIDAGISIAPGRIFSPSGRFRNYVRLSFGHPWSADIEHAIRWLGRRASEQLKD